MKKFEFVFLFNAAGQVVARVRLPADSVYRAATCEPQQIRLSDAVANKITSAKEWSSEMFVFWRGERIPTRLCAKVNAKTLQAEYFALTIGGRE